MEKVIILTEQEAKNYEKYLETVNENCSLWDENAKLKQDIAIYKRRETAMSKIKSIDGLLHCPVCNYVVDYRIIPPQSYCDNCGQKLIKVGREWKK